MITSIAEETTFAWRLLLLFVIGNINAAFFTGEILMLYSLVGFVLIPTCRLSTKTLVAIVVICMLQPVCLYHIIRAVLSPDYATPHLDYGSMWKLTNEMQSNGTFLEMLKANLWEGQLFSLGWAWENGRIFQTAGLFIAGMLIGRQGWFKKEHLHHWGYVLAVATILYFPLNGLNSMKADFIANSNITSPLGILLSSLSKLCIMLMIVSGILFGYYCSARAKRCLTMLIPYGKLSMTNYVTQGIIGSALFYHWGLHLQLGITASVFVGVAIFLVQYMFCRYWVGRHNHGPLEYIWKKATWIQV